MDDVPTPFWVHWFTNRRFSNPSAKFPQPSTRRSSIAVKKPQPQWLDSRKPVSGEFGAVHGLAESLEGSKEIMSMTRNLVLLTAWMTCGTALAAPSGVRIRTYRSDVAVTVERNLSDGKALVSVLDAREEPVFGLTEKDFSVVRAGVRANVTQAIPVSKSMDAPRHVVLVLDNSASMVERDASKQLLAGVGATLKNVRPIDDVQIIVFNETKTVSMAGHALHVEVFKSGKTAELEAFAAKAFSKEGITSTTFLYEAVFAGVELIKRTPADDPRFLVVFSDGDDINSTLKGDFVSQSARGLENFRAFVIDFRKGSKTDEFLAAFASQNRGQVRKAGTGADLLAVFQGFATRIDHCYVIKYEFPTPPPVAKTMVFSSAALFGFDKYELKPEGKEKLKEYAQQAKAEMTRADKVWITGHTDSVGAADYNTLLSLKRAEAVREYLVSLGVNFDKIVIAGEGMTEPVADNGTEEGRAANRRVEIDVIGMGK